MTATTTSATTRAASMPSTNSVDAGDDTRPVELAALLVLFVALVGLAVTQLDTALAGFGLLANH